MFRIVVSLAIVATELFAQGLTIRTVVTNLDTPWEVLWGPDGWLWVTERPGRISRIHPETGEQRTLAVLSDVYEQGESGLLGMALHPNFADSPYVYVAYTWREGTQIFERIARFTYNGSALDGMRILLDRIPGATIHDGCRLLMMPDGTLLATTGDANVASRAQDLQSLNGKILRLRLDGTIPEDNPFPSSFVWSYGHRNAQGLAWHEGILYSSEHCPNSDDEVNIVESGRNYGWPDVMGYCDAPTEREFCRTNGVVEPIAVWTPTVAPCGIAYYSGGRFPEWANSLLVTTLKASRLIVLGLDSSRRRVMSERQYLTGVLGRLRGVCVSPDGRVFVGTSNRDGRGTPRTGDDQIVEIVLATSSVPASSAPEWWFVADNHNHTQMIALRLPTDSSVRLELTDIHARHSYIWDFGRIAAGEYRFELDTRGIPSGAYAATLAVNHLPQSRKFVIIVP